MKNKLAMIAAAGLLAPAIASADPNYNFVEANYVAYEDFLGINGFDPDGFRLKGSTGFTEEVFGFGEYSRISDRGADLDFVTLGIGLRAPVAPDTDIYGGASYEYADFGVDGHGFGLRAGARTLISEHFELKGEVRYLNWRGDIDEDVFGFNLGVQFHVTPQIGLVLEYDNLDGENGLIAGARFNF